MIGQIDFEQYRMVEDKNDPNHLCEFHGYLASGGFGVVYQGIEVVIRFFKNRNMY